MPLIEAIIKLNLTTKLHLFILTRLTLDDTDPEVKQILF